MLLWGFDINNANDMLQEDALVCFRNFKQLIKQVGDKLEKLKFIE